MSTTPREPRARTPVRMERGLHRRIVAAARREHVSVNQWISARLREAVAKDAKPGA